MCDVGETRVLPTSGTTAAVLVKLRRPSCDEQQKSEQQQSPQQKPDKEARSAGANTRSTPSTPTSLRRDANLEKCFSEPEFFRKQRRRQGTSSSGLDNGRAVDAENLGDDAQSQVARTNSDNVKVTTNGASRACKASHESDTCNNSKDIMAPVLGVPPPPPPAPHMGPDGLILPRKPYNPCMTSSSHKELHRELLFNQKIGKNVLNQKSELQRALERHREMVSRKEAERNQEESHKNDPRTALQRAIEQRAKHLLQSQQSQPTEPVNPLASARAKLRSRTESQ